MDLPLQDLAERKVATQTTTFQMIITLHCLHNLLVSEGNPLSTVKHLVGDGEVSTAPTTSDKQAPIKGDSYLAMIESAFACSDLLRFGDGR